MHEAKSAERKSVKKLNRLRRNNTCQRITLHAFQNCRPPNFTAKFQITTFDTVMRLFLVF